MFLFRKTWNTIRLEMDRRTKCTKRTGTRNPWHRPISCRNTSTRLLSRITKKPTNITQYRLWTLPHWLLPVYHCYLWIIRPRTSCYPRMSGQSSLRLVPRGASRVGRIIMIIRPCRLARGMRRTCRMWICLILLLHSWPKIHGRTILTPLVGVGTVGTMHACRTRRRRIPSLRWGTSRRR